MLLGESSFLLWLMAAIGALLSAYLFIGWTHRAQSAAPGRSAVGPVVLAAAALGAGLPSSMVLAMSAEALAFPLGYRWSLVPVLYLAPMLLCVPAAWWLSRRQGWLALGAVGLLLALVVAGTQTGWLLAAGLRPGLRWNPGLAGLAFGISVAGFTAGLWLAYSDTSGDGARKTLWRVGGAALMTLTLLMSQEVMIWAAGLTSQASSVYQREASSTLMCLLAGALVPTVLAALALSLVLRNKSERGRGGGHYASVGTSRRRKRRRKYRVL